MEQEAINLEELKLSDRLAVERTAMAADRSLLAWMRTSLSLISFGFTIFKVLENFVKVGDIKYLRAETPRNLGIFLILLGTLPLMLAIFQYLRGMQRLGRKAVYLQPGIVAAAAILLLGFALLVVTVANLNLL